MRVINSLDELLRLPRDPRVNGFGARAALRLEIPELTRHALLRAQGTLNRLQSRCGCLAGALATLITLGVGVRWLWRSDLDWTSWAAVRALVLLVAAAFIAGFTAKFTTLAITRWQFARRCRRQHRLLVDELLTLRGKHVDLHAMGR